MNKYKVALDLYDYVVNNALENGNYDFTDDELALLDSNPLQELIDKETPVEPITHNSEGLLAVGTCPKCRKAVLDYLRKYPYCPMCGQKIKWSKSVLEKIRL